MIINIFLLSYEDEDTGESTCIIESFEGKTFVDGRQNDELSISFIKQEDTCYLNGRRVSFFLAMHNVKQWIQAADLCFTIGADKAKHNLRHQFYFSYLNPYEHEWSKGDLRIYDYFDLVGFCTYMGGDAPSLPISPLGELSADYSKMAHKNGFGDDVFQFLGLSASKMVDEAGWNKTRRLVEKRKALVPQIPCVLLLRRYKEVDIEPLTVIPVCWSTKYKNRCFIFIPSRGVLNISAAVSYLEQADDDITSNIVNHALGVSYVDITKSNSLLPLGSMSATVQRSLTWHTYRSKNALTPKEYIKSLEKIERLGEQKLFSRKRSSALYSLQSVRQTNVRSEKIRRELDREYQGYGAAKGKILQYMKEDMKAEIIRLKQFNRRNPESILMDIAESLDADG